MIDKTTNEDGNNGCLTYLKDSLLFAKPATAGGFNLPLSQLVLSKEDHNAYIGSSSSPPTWLQISFGQKFIKPTSYIIQGRRYYSSSHQLKSWELEGFSVRDGKWVMINSQANQLLSNYQYKTFSIATNMFFNSFRLSMTDVNSDDAWYLCIGHIEIFGFISDLDQSSTPKKSRFQHNSITRNKNFRLFLVLVISS